MIYTDQNLLITRAKQQLNIQIQLHPYQSHTQDKFDISKKIKMLPIQTKDKIIPKKLNINNSKYVINTLKRACNGCIKKNFPIW